MTKTQGVAALYPGLKLANAFGVSNQHQVRERKVATIPGEEALRRVRDSIR